MTRTHTTRYVTLLSVVLALSLTAALAACGSDEPSGVTDPDRTASTPTETPVSPTQTPTTPASGDASTATDAPEPAAATATAPPTATDTPVPATATAPPAPARSDESDREALVALYNATDGENWSVSDNWLSDAPLGEWYGVITNDDGRVIELELGENDLSGEIPAELANLSNLEKLYLHANGLSGEIPPELGSLSNLRWLFLGDNALSGEIPAELGSLNLRFLGLYDTALSGCVPSSLEDRLDLRTGLTVLDLPFC